MRNHGVILRKEMSQFRRQAEELLIMVDDFQRDISKPNDKESSHQVKKKKRD